MGTALSRIWNVLHIIPSLDLVASKREYVHTQDFSVCFSVVPHHGNSDSLENPLDTLVEGGYIYFDRALNAQRRNLMSLIRYNPTFSPMRHTSMDSLLDDFKDIFDVFDPMARRPSMMSPRTNTETLEDKHVITLATPGVSRDDIKVDVEDGRLTISFDQENSENSNYRFQNSFEKSWSLGDNIDLDNIKADYSDGVLIVEVPKADKVIPTARRIEIN